MKSRRGFTLIELLASMSVGAVVLGLCAGLIHSLLRLERSGRDQTISAVSLTRLERDFRAHVHAATSAEILEKEGEAQPQLQLSLPDDVIIEFQAVQGGITRLRRSGSGRLQRELYRLGRESSARWDVESQVDIEIIVLHLVPDNRKQEGPIHIEAIRGHHHRYQNTGNSK